MTEGPTSPLAARHLLWLGQAEARLGRPAAAGAAYRRGIALLRGPAGDNGALRAEIETALAQVAPLPRHR